MFPEPLQATTSFYQDSQRKLSTPWPKDNPEEEIKPSQEQVYEVLLDRIIPSPPYSPALPYFSRVQRDKDINLLIVKIMLLIYPM